MTSIDLAVAVEAIYPPDAEGGAAQYRAAGSYEELVATWEDAREVPTQEALQQAWEAWQAEEDARQQADQARDAKPLFAMTVDEIVAWADGQGDATFKRELAVAFVQLRDLLTRPRGR
jgi:hypothetical protein